MKDKTVNLMKQAGLSEQQAQKAWQDLVDQACGGAEPTEAGAALLSDEDVLASQGANKLAGRAILAALRSVQGTPTASPAAPKKFKPEKVSRYGEAEIVAFLVGEDKLSPADRTVLRGEIALRTGGAPFRFLVDGKLAERETAARIAALADGEPVAPFVVIDGREVEPVGFDSDEVLEDDEDPFDPGVALGQPGSVSRKLGISLEGLSFEVRQVLRLVYENDLPDASLSELRQTAKWAAGMSVADIVNNHPLVHRRWSRLSRSLPKLKVLRRPFVAEAAKSPTQFAVAPAAKPGSVSIFVLGAREEGAAADALKKHLTPSARSGLLTIQSDADCPAGYDRRAWLSQRLSEAAVVILLMSADTICKFDISDFASKLVPLLVRYCGWKDVPELSRYGILPRNQRPVDGDVGWTTVAAEFVAHAKRLAGR